MPSIMVGIYSIFLPIYMRLKGASQSPRCAPHRLSRCPHCK